MPRRWKPGAVCCWCDERIEHVARKHQRFHGGCRRHAHKALGRALKKCKDEGKRDLLRRWVHVLEEKHRLLRRDALRVAADRLADAELEVWSGKAQSVADVDPTAYRLRICHLGACPSCGDALARKSTANTCGSGACRAKLRRRRLAREVRELEPEVNDVPPDSMVTG